MPCRPHRATTQLVTLLTFTLFFLFWLLDLPFELHAVIYVVPTWIGIATLVESTKLPVEQSLHCGESCGLTTVGRMSRRESARSRHSRFQHR